MLSLVQVRVLKTTVVSAAILMTVLGCAKKEDETTGGSTTTLSGTYETSCVAIGGMVIGGATHTKSSIQFNSDGTFEFVKWFKSDAGCSTNAYAVNQQGTFAIGSATTSPAAGFDIVYTITESNILLYTAGAKTDFENGCPSHGPYTAAPSLRPLYADIACANATMQFDGTLYNNFVKTGASALTMGTGAGDNPGVATIGAVSATQSLSFTK
jgi:hypothetical protein